MSPPGTPGWRHAEAARLLSFGKAAALPGGGFGWLGTDGRVDPAQPRPLYLNARMTHVFSLAHLAGVPGAEPLAASGLWVLAARYADRDNGGWFAALDSQGRVGRRGLVGGQEDMIVDMALDLSASGQGLGLTSAREQARA